MEIETHYALRCLLDAQTGLRSIAPELAKLRRRLDKIMKAKGLEAARPVHDAIVAAVLEEANAPMALPEIYERIDGHRRCTGNPHWRDKIRQILHESPLFTAVSRGVYKYAG